MSEQCKRGLGKTLIPAWCAKCEKDNIFKRYCDTTRRMVNEKEATETLICDSVLNIRYRIRARKTLKEALEKENEKT